MTFHRSVLSSVSPSVLVRAHRDELVQWGPRMPEVDRITRLYAHTRGDALVTGHRWWGASSALPWVLRPLVPADALQWDDEQLWEGSTCRWSLRIPALGESAAISGVQTYSAHPSGTRVTLEGRIRFVPGSGPLVVPAAVAPVVERFMASMMGAILERSVETLAVYARAA